MTYRPRLSPAITFLAALLVLGLAACAAPGAEPAATPEVTAQVLPTPEPTEPPATEVGPPANLESMGWQLLTYRNEAGEMVDFLPLAPATAAFKDGTMSGTTGCNQYSAAYEIAGDTMKVSAPTLTRRACEEDVNAQETAFVAAIQATASFTLSADELTFHDAAGEPVLVFVARQPMPLVGTDWVLESYANAEGGLVAAVEGAQTTALFDADGAVSGNGGCNGYSASYEIDGEKLTLTPAISTEVFCSEPAGVMEQETAFLGAFERVASFEIRGEMLELRDANGALLASLTASRELPLVGTTWQLVRYDAGGGDVVETIAGTTLTAVFDDTGTVGGMSGCNQYSAEYTADDSAMTIGQPIATLIACSDPAGVMDQESAFLHALESVASYQLRDYGLELRDASGALLAEFKPQLTR